MKSELQDKARSLGFDACRITTAHPPDSGPKFEAWLQAGHHGEMGYLQRNAFKRTDPQQVLPGARSIVTLAASYHHPAFQSRQVPDPGANAGVIARYARYADYHDVLASPLKQLADWLSDHHQAPSRSLWYVDTGPFLERDLAQRAGLGFVGKHTNLISRGLGNWFFLAELITTIELPADSSEKNRCGSCTRCITACPTEAITAPFQLDARKCISYLTIELKGSIPEHLRPAIGNRIYGCDDCLLACPWNRFAKDGRLMRDHHRNDFDTPELIELLGLDADGFKRRFSGTPMVRTKRRGLLRNVCVALGNTGGPEALPALHKAASDAEPLIAEHARWAIDRIRKRQSEAT